MEERGKGREAEEETESFITKLLSALQSTATGKADYNNAVAEYQLAGWQATSGLSASPFTPLNSSETVLLTLQLAASSP